LTALEKGKHVLLEKPSVSNSEEAELLFHSPLLNKPGAPILLEAVHYCFHPTWHYFMSQINPAEVVYARHTVLVPSGFIPPTDIRYNHKLAGGAIMDIGSYGVSALRAVFKAEPESCLECNVTPTVAPASELCDAQYTAKLQFPNGAIGEIQGNYNSPWLKFRLPNIEVLHRATEVQDTSLNPNHVKTRTRKVIFYGHMFATIYNRIDTEDTYEVRNKSDQQLVKKWTEKKTKSAHAFRDIEVDQPGEVYWKSYRYQLEQFVHRIKGRTGDGVWVSADQSIAQMKAIDMVYEKSGMGVRPSSERPVS
jgi:predicted dehydrogenase